MPVQEKINGVTTRDYVMLSSSILSSSSFSEEDEEEGSECVAVTAQLPNYETDLNGCRRRDDEVEEEDPVANRRRGSTKRLTTTTKTRLRQRRVQANARERSRMHGLNDALEHLRRHVPFHSQTQKLSKIETLRLARNYIEALTTILSTDRRPNQILFARKLCRGLSPSSVNFVASSFEVSPRLLLQTPDGVETEESFVYYASNCLLSSDAPSFSVPPLTPVPRSVEPFCSASDAIASSPCSYWTPTNHVILDVYDHSTLHPSSSDQLLDSGYSTPCRPQRHPTPLLLTDPFALCPDAALPCQSPLCVMHPTTDFTPEEQQQQQLYISSGVSELETLVPCALSKSDHFLAQPWP